jgi:hypothetical protein
MAEDPIHALTGCTHPFHRKWEVHPIFSGSTFDENSLAQAIPEKRHSIGATNEHSENIYSQISLRGSANRREVHPQSQVQDLVGAESYILNLVSELRKSDLNRCGRC